MYLQKLKHLLTNPRLRIVAGSLITLITVVLFIRFFIQHPQYKSSLRHIRASVILEILALNGLLTVVLAISYNYLILMCGKRIAFREVLLLTAYSSIANFFGPLQGGPGVRAVYLKTKHQIRMRDFTLATLISMAFYAMISAGLLLGGSRPWWQTISGLVIVAVGSITLINWFQKKGRAKEKRTKLDLKPVYLFGLLLATVGIVLIVTAYYFIELHAVTKLVSLRQAIVYSGAANFALFVSFTPDAVGIRESFLVLSRKLHHIATAYILAANVIDRASYVVYLGLLFIVVLALHVKDKLGLRRTGQESPSA